jgi:hypothetical protein
MILVRIEPESCGNFPATIEQKRQSYLSTIPEVHRKRFAEKFDSGDWGNNIGCWFMPAYSKTNDVLDALVYANDIIKSDHEGKDLRIIAIEIDDNEADKYRVSNMPSTSFARKRSKTPDAEYLIPTDIIIKKGRVIGTIASNTEITEIDYRQILLSFEQNLSQKPHVKISTMQLKAR